MPRIDAKAINNEVQTVDQINAFSTEKIRAYQKQVSSVTYSLQQSG
ncbi:MAG: hypothetical protein KGZ88_11375 [Methylomicrobium sp.]|nr:hypothetical protein [Methylomicrobium sp.]